MKSLKKLRFIVEFIALKIFVIFLRLLPFSLAIIMGEQFCRLAARFKHKRLDLNVSDIVRALGVSEEEARKIAIDSWKNMGRILVETVKFSYMPKEKFLSKYIELKNFELFEAQAKTGVGAIAHTGHFTNWEAFGFAASAMGIDKAVIAQRTENPYIDTEVNRVRNVFGGKIITTDAPFFPSVKWLKQGKLMGILSDQNSYTSAVFTKFMGRYCATSPLTALLALKMRVPVYPVKITRNGKKIVIETLPAAPIEYDKPFSPELLEDTVNLLNKYYEDWIRENPSSWLWAHKRWKREGDRPNA